MNKKIIVSGGCSELIGFVSVDADMDGEFVITEEGTGMKFKVCGWNCDIQDVD